MEFADWRGWFKGEHCVVVAPGPSAPCVSTAYYSNRWTIGCNRAVHFCRPDLAICFEPFVDPCWVSMRKAEPAVVFSHLCTDRRGRKPHPRIVQVPTKNVLDWFRPDRLDTDRELWVAQAPFWGAAVAVWLGFSRVGIVGVDWNDEKRFGRTMRRENEKFGELVVIATAEGCELVNLSPVSRLKAVPPGALYSIEGKAEKETPKR